MGAPAVSTEKLSNGTELIKCTEYFTQNYNIDYITCAEIGGFNSLFPLYTAVMLDKIVVDNDFMGRAFPELQMTTGFIYGLPCVPVAIADEKGNQVVLDD